MLLSRPKLARLTATDLEPVPGVVIKPLPAKPSQAIIHLPPKKRSRSWLGPLGFFSFLTVCFTYPLVFNLTQAVPGIEPKDRLQNLWNLWWVKQAFLHFQNPYQTDRLFFPYYQPPFAPLPLYFHDLQVLNGLLTLPFQLIGGVALAYNMVIIGACVLSGLITYWLIRYLGGSDIAGLSGGAIYAFSPFRFSAIDQSITNIQSTEFLPLLALCVYSIYYPRPFKTAAEETGQSQSKRLARDQWQVSTLSLAPLTTTKKLAGAVLALTACCYTDWYNTIYLLALSLLLLVWQIIHHSPRQWWQQLRPMVIIGLATFALVSPLLLPSIANLTNPAFKTVLGYDSELNGSATLSSLFLPTSPNPGDVIQRWTSGSLGYTGLFLTLLALGLSYGTKKPVANWSRKTTLGLWGMVSLVGLVMSLGPQLMITHTLTTSIPLPYALFRLLPLVDITRAPQRFVILVSLGLAILSAYGIDLCSLYLSRWLSSKPRVEFPNRKKRVEIGLLVLVVGAIAVENWTPLPIFAVTPDPFIAQLATEPGDFNLLELPITRHYNHDQVRMYNQITHNHPILGGYLSRPVVDPYRDAGSPFAPIADMVFRLKRFPQDIIPATTNEQDLDTLVGLYNFRYILLYTQEFDDPSQLSGWVDLLSAHYGASQKVYSNTELTVYRVPDSYLPPANTNSLNLTKLALGTGWYGMENQNKDGTMGRWMSGQSELELTTFNPRAVHLHLQLRAFATTRMLQLKVNGQVVLTTSVPPDQFVNVDQSVGVVSGINNIELVSLQGASVPSQLDPKSTDTRNLAFAVSQIRVAELK